MLIKGNSGALASVISGNSGGASAPAAVAVVGGGGGSITSATLKTADVAEPVEFVFEDGMIWCEMPQQVAEGSPVYLTFTNGALSIVID